MAENMFLGKEPRRFGLLDRARMHREATELLGRVGLRIDPATELGDLSAAAQQMVAIARALSFDAKLLIMDEPTSSLHDKEVETLFDLIRELKRTGVAIVFVSHKLDELYRICDRITILLDGRTVLTQELADLSRLDLVATMLGREPDEVQLENQTSFSRAKTAPGKPLLVTEHISMSDMRDRFRLVANVVENVAAPDLPKLPVGRAVWVPQPDFATSAACWLTAGAAHHTVMSTAVGVDVFRDFAEMVRSELLVIDDSTTLREFQKEVRWNAAYFRLARGI